MAKRIVSQSDSGSKQSQKHNLNTQLHWLDKATGFGDCNDALSWAFRYDYQGKRVLMAADGYRLHMLWGFPDTAVVPENVAENGIEAIKLNFSQDLNAALKFTEKLPKATDSILALVRPTDANAYQINPRELFRYLVKFDDFDPYICVLKFQDRNLTVTVDDEESQQFVASGESAFTGKYNCIYLIDALWFFLHRTKITMWVHTGEFPTVAFGEIGKAIAVIMPMRRANEAHDANGGQS